MRLRSLVISVATLATVAGTGVAVSVGGSTASAQPTAPVFSVLARPATAADQLPNRRISIPRLVQDVPQLDVASARLVSATAERSFALISRSDGQTCLVSSAADGSGGIACLPNGVAAAEGLAFTGPGAGVGVAPDGVRAVTFSLADGSQSSVDVGVGGLYRAPAEAVRGSFVVDGVTRVREFTPKSALPKGVEPDATGRVVVRGRAG